MSHAQKNYIWIHVRDYRYITLFWVFFFCSQYIDRKKTWSIYNLEHYFFFFLIQACIINFTFLFICFIRQIWWNCWFGKKKDMKNVLTKTKDSFMILHVFIFHDFFYKSLPQVYQHILQHCRLLQSSCAYKINTHCNSSKHHGQTF